MFFIIKNKRYLSEDQLRTGSLLNAYMIIKNYPLNASEQLLNSYLEQQHKSSLKDLCIQLLLSTTYYTNDKNDLVLLFKDPKYDKLAQLITYGNGAIPGSRILKIALSN